MKVTVIALALLASAAPGGVLFEDRFDGKLADGWEWVREEKDGWRVKDGSLEVRASPGNLWEAQNTATNLLLRPVPGGAGTFVVEVTVTNAPATFGEQAGLLLYRDDDHYVKLTREFYDGKTWVVLAAEQAGKAQYKEAECRAAKVVLRLTVGKGAVTGEFRVAGTDKWTPVGRLPYESAGAPRVGLTAHHGPAADARWATFNQFRILAVE